MSRKKSEQPDAPAQQNQEIDSLRAAIQGESEARRLAETQRARFLSLTIEALCVTDVEGRMVEVSPACEATLGYPAQGLLGRYFLSFLHPQDKLSLRAQMRNLAAGQPAVTLDLRWRSGDGGYKWLSWEATLDREQRRTYAVLRDTSERRHLEEALADERHLLTTMRNFAGMLAGSE